MTVSAANEQYRIWIAIAIFAAAISPASANNWTDGTGNWNVAGNWSGGVPGAGQTINIVNTDGTARTVTLNVAPPSLALTSIDLTGAGTAANSLSMPNNFNFTSSALFIGGYNGSGPTNGRGAMTQAAGTVAMNAGTDFVLGHGAGSTGTYTMSGGALTAPQSEFIGSNGTGTFNQSGGINTINAGAIGYFNMGTGATGTGIYNLSGGQFISSKVERIGDAGTAIFNHSGGTNTILGAQDLILGNVAGSNGTYTLTNNASLTIGNNLSVGVNGTGTININDTSSVNVQNNLVTGNNANINVNGGTLRMNSISGPIGHINFNSGTIQLGGAHIFSSNTVDSVLDQVIGFVEVDAGKTLIIEGGAGAVGMKINKASGTGFEVEGTFKSLKDIQVGTDEDGYLVIPDGGKVYTPNAKIGVDTGSGLGSGSVNLYGNGAIWQNTGDLYVGDDGADGFAIIGGGALLDTNLLFIGNEGNVILDGGTIRFDLYGRAGAGTFTFSRGTIIMQGDRDVNLGFPIPDLFGEQPTIQAGKNLTIEGTTTVEGVLTIAGGIFKTSAIHLDPGAQINFQSGVLELTTGTITNLAQMNVPTSGELRVLGFQTYRVAGAAGSTITATGNLTLGNASAVNGFGTQGTLNVGANLVAVADANDAVFDSLSLVNLGSGASPGTLSAVNGLTLDFGGNIAGVGTISTPNSIAKPLLNNGHITGNSAAQRITLPGYVKGVGTLDNVNLTGTYSPGLSPTIAIVGSVALSNTSILVMELGGTTAGSGYDQIQATALTLDGILQLALINGFTPSAGQSFNLFDGALTGAFDTLQLPSVAGLTWNTSQLYSNGVISLVSAGLSGDYNQNGIVDAADYTVWRDHLGSAVSLPNDDTAGVGPDDYTRWKTHFGQTAGSGAGSPSSPVPEPAAAISIVVSAAISALPRRRPRNRR